MDIGRLVRGLLCIKALTLGILLSMVGSAFTAIPQQEWVARYNGPGNGGDSAVATATDDLGNVYVAGGSDGGISHGDYALIKYDPNGQELWVARYNGTGNGTDSATALALDIMGSVYVTGSICSQVDPIYGSCTDYDIATVKYDVQGQEVWAVRYDGPGGLLGDRDGASSIAVDASGNVYVTGSICTELESGYDLYRIRLCDDQVRC